MIRQLLSFTALALALGAPAHAQAPAPAYPNKPIRMIVGYAPGGGSDIMGRLIDSSERALKLQAFLADPPLPAADEAPAPAAGGNRLRR